MKTQAYTFHLTNVYYNRHCFTRLRIRPDAARRG